MDQSDIVTTIVPTDEKTGDLRIVGKLYQPWPPHPDAARNARRRGSFTFPSLWTQMEVCRGSESSNRSTSFSTSRQWKLFAAGGL